MGEEHKANAMPPESSREAQRQSFLGWQCRIRQLSVRRGGGRPTSGMRPQVLLGDGVEALGPIIVLIIKREPEEMTSQFQHLFRRTHDPAARYESAVRYLAAAYYQRPGEFSDELTALFGSDSTIARRLLDAESCLLEFEQYSQRYDLPCKVRDLPESHPAYHATYWHNSLFNPAIPGQVRVLGFQPDWLRVVADPPID